MAHTPLRVLYTIAYAWRYTGTGIYGHINTTLKAKLKCYDVTAPLTLFYVSDSWVKNTNIIINIQTYEIIYYFFINFRDVPSQTKYKTKVGWTKCLYIAGS
jgi:hypothetical protein